MPIVASIGSAYSIPSVSMIACSRTWYRIYRHRQNDSIIILQSPLLIGTMRIAEALRMRIICSSMYMRNFGDFASIQWFEWFQLLLCRFTWYRATKSSHPLYRDVLFVRVLVSVVQTEWRCGPSNFIFSLHLYTHLMATRLLWVAVADHLILFSLYIYMLPRWQRDYFEFSCTASIFVVQNSCCLIAAILFIWCLLRHPSGLSIRFLKVSAKACSKNWYWIHRRRQNESIAIFQSLLVIATMRIAEDYRMRIISVCMRLRKFAHFASILWCKWFRLLSCSFSWYRAHQSSRRLCVMHRLYVSLFL